MEISRRGHKNDKINKNGNPDMAKKKNGNLPRGPKNGNSGGSRVTVTTVWTRERDMIDFLLGFLSHPSSSLPTTTYPPIPIPSTRLLRVAARTRDVARPREAGRVTDRRVRRQRGAGTGQRGCSDRLKDLLAEYPDIDR